jgi:hypothetical protein
MQLTISSDDRLEDVLRVLGALHDVDLTSRLRAAPASAAASSLDALRAEDDDDGFRTKTRHGKAT